MADATEIIRQYIGKDSKPEPLLSRNGEPVIFPNTVNVIQGKTGCHKSRLAQQISAELISTEPFDFGEFLDFKVNKEAFPNLTVIYIDTERDMRYQFAQAITQIVEMAGYSPEAPPLSIRYTSVRQVGRLIRSNAVMAYIAQLRKEIEGHLFVVIDVITDFGDDFNDLQETYKFMDFLNSTSDQHDVTFLAVIHENPGNSKARGHLGTELVNKATTVFQIGHYGTVNEVSVYRIDFKKTRATRHYEPLYVKYDTGSGGLQSASSNEISKSGSVRASKITGPALLSFLGSILIEPMSKSDLINLIMPEFTCKIRLVEDRLKEIIEGSHVVPGPNGEEFNLVKENTKPVRFRLKPVAH